MTFGELKAQVGNWMREAVEDSLLNDATNDAIENLWMSVICVRLEEYLGGPVSNINLASGAERFQLVSVTDPIVAPVVNNVATGALPAVAVDVAITHVTESGSETNVSPIQAANRLLNNVLQVQTPGAATGGIGYNIYMGPHNGALARQNSIPVDYALPWQEPETGYVAAPDAPLAPTANTTGDNIYFIEHIEIQLPDTTYKAWNASDLDSVLSRTLARTTASASPYQTYVWDIISGNQFEIRPPAGIGLSPRYFFVQKPRRMRFDNATLPFTTLPSALFLRCFAISLLKLAAEEYQASQMWDQKATTERVLILQSLAKKGANRNDRVTPYMT